MNGLPFELILLLGVDFAEKYLKLVRVEKDYCGSEQIECISHIKKIIRNLIEVVEINYLASVFQVSECFLLLISKKGKKAGHCLACDVFCSNLKSHFKHVHDLTKTHYLAYKNSFGPQTENFYPSSTQKTKFFSPYTSKTPDLHKFRESLNIKSKPRTSIIGKRSKSTPVSEKTQSNTSSGSKYSLRKILSNLATKYREKIQVSSLSPKKARKKGQNLKPSSNSDEIKEKFNSFNKFSNGFEVINTPKGLSNHETFKKLSKKSQKSKSKDNLELFSDDLLECPLCNLKIRKKGLKKHLKSHERRNTFNIE
jgi:hypothetical protein